MMNFQKILEQVAAENNTTPEEVYREMQETLKDAYQHRTDSAETCRLWSALGLEKECPTPERFIATMALAAADASDIVQ